MYVPDTFPVVGLAISVTLAALIYRLVNGKCVRVSFRSAGLGSETPLARLQDVCIQGEKKITKKKSFENPILKESEPRGFRLDARQWL